MKLTLDQAWTRCLAMWRWVVAEKKKRSKARVWDLKCEYRTEHDPNADLYNDCYFCEYDYHRGVEGCAWDLEPAAFLRKIERLHKKYLAQKRG